jgi:hypothetical protein
MAPSMTVLQPSSKPIEPRGHTIGMMKEGLFQVAQEVRRRSSRPVSSTIVLSSPLVIVAPIRLDTERESSKPHGRPTAEGDYLC